MESDIQHIQEDEKIAKHLSGYLGTRVSDNRLALKTRGKREKGLGYGNSYST